MKTRVKITIAAAVLVAAISGGLATAQPTIPSPTRAAGLDCADYPEGEACVSGVCIEVSSGAVCSSVCLTNADCLLPGYGCRKVHQGNGEKVGLCFPIRQVVNP